MPIEKGITMQRHRIETEFLPAALEISNTAPPPASRVLVGTIVALCAATLAWASLSEIDIVAVAPGRVVPSGHSKVVQPLELGTVRAIAVSDGDRVSAGDTLIELDKAAADADVQRIRHELDVADREAARLRRLSELTASGEDTLGPDDADPVLVSRWREQLAREEALRRERDRRGAELDTAERELGKLDALLPFVERRAADQKTLADRKLVADQQYRDAELQRVETREEMEVQRRRIAVAASALREIDAAMARGRAEFARLVSEELDDVERRSAALGQELIKAQARLEAHTLTAPIDGVVQQLAVHSVGGIVTPAQTLLVVVPETDRVEVEALVANKDAGFVAEGQHAQVKLDAYPFTRYGTVPGRVRRLSRDAVADERQGLVFRAAVELDRPFLESNGGRLPIGPGLATTVEIRTGSRRVIEYVLSPLLRYRAEALRER
jgi:membrane fusion protein, hemolysin D